MKTRFAATRKETGKIPTTRFHDLAIICEIIDVTTDHHDGGPAGYYDHHTRTISTRRGPSSALYRSALAHEIGHATFRDHPTTHDHFDQKQETRADRFAIRLLFNDDDFENRVRLVRTRHPRPRRRVGMLPTPHPHLRDTQETRLNMAPQHTFRRTLTVDPASVYQPLIDGIPTIKDCTVTDAGNPIIVTRKRNMLANRWAMQAMITTDGQELVITIDSEGTALPKFAAEILDVLPEGAVHDHGLAAARERMAKSERWFGVLELSNLNNDLRHGEEVLMMATGQVNKHMALIIVTTRRIITKDKGAFDNAAREILPKHITSISTGSKMTGEWPGLTVSGSEVKFTALQHGRGGQIAEHIRKLRDSAAAPAPGPGPTGPGVDDLEKLAELHAAGVLSDEESTAAKAKALGL